MMLKGSKKCSWNWVPLSKDDSMVKGFQGCMCQPSSCHWDVWYLWIVYSTYYIPWQNKQLLGPPFVHSFTDVSVMYMCILGGYHQSGWDTRPMMTLGNKPKHAEPQSPLPVSPVLSRATQCPSCQQAHAIWKMESIRETLIKIALRVDRKHCFITHLPFLACCCTNVLHAAQTCITIG